MPRVHRLNEMAFSSSAQFLGWDELDCNCLREIPDAPM